MKVLTIVTTKFDISGITNSVMNHYRYMDKEDMDIDFVVPNQVPKRLRDEINKNKSCIYELVMRNKNPFQYFKKLKNIMKKGNYNIVHAHGNSSTLAIEMLAAKQSGIKVRIAHSRNTTCKHTILHKFLRPIFNKTYTHGFACGVDAGNWLFGDKNFKVLTNGNDVNKFSYREDVRDKYRKKYNLKDKKVIGHVGFFNTQKNHEFIIDTMNELIKISSNYILILIGKGHLKPYIEQKVNELGLKENVIFVGESLKVEEFLQAMDIMLLPSLYEGLPNVIVESQIACLPSLVSDNVTSECKLTNLVEFLSLESGPKAWAEKINSIPVIDRKAKSNYIVEEIKKSGFDVQENAKNLKRIYKELVN